MSPYYLWRKFLVHCHPFLPLFVVVSFVFFWQATFLLANNFLWRWLTLITFSFFRFFLAAKLKKTKNVAVNFISFFCGCNYFLSFLCGHNYYFWSQLYHYLVNFQTFGLYYFDCNRLSLLVFFWGAPQIYCMILAPKVDIDRKSGCKFDRFWILNKPRL